MIKRILPFVLVFAVLLSVMVSPMRVKADLGYSVDLLDFMTLHGASNNVFSFNQSGSCTYNSAATLGEIRVYKFDIYLTWSGSEPTSYGLSNGGSLDFDVTVTELGYHSVRLTGTCSGNFLYKFVISMTSGGYTYVQFLSFDVALISDNRDDLGTTLFASAGSSTAVMSPGGQASVSSPSGVTTALFYFQFPYSVWGNYDYIDFSGYIANAEITSISAFVVNDAYVPISTSVIQDMNSRSFYYYSARIDLTVGNLGSSGNLAVYVNADVITNSGEFGLWGLSGVIIGEEFDTQNTWYQILYRNMKSGFSSVDGSVVDLMDLVDTWFDETNGNLAGWFDNLNTNLDTEFTNLKTKLQTEFTALKTALSTHFTNIINNLSTWFSNMQTLLTSKFDTVISKLQELIDGQAVDEGVTDDMQQSEDDLGNMTDQMEQLSPTINAGDIEVDVDDIVPQEGLSSVSGVLSIFTGFNIIASMITTVMALATVGYVFFGKR